MSLADDNAFSKSCVSNLGAAAALGSEYDGQGRAYNPSFVISETSGMSTLDVMSGMGEEHLACISSVLVTWSGPMILAAGCLQFSADLCLGIVPVSLKPGLYCSGGIIGV